MSARLAAIELVLDDVKQAAMQPFHQRQRFEIERSDVIEPASRSAGSTVLATAFMVTPSFCRFLIARPCSPVMCQPTPWSKFDLNNTIKIKFICEGEWEIDATMTGLARNESFTMPSLGRAAHGRFFRSRAGTG